MISCTGCGQSMRFDPKLQMMYCDYCDNQPDPATCVSGQDATDANASNTFETSLFTCPQCGGEILSDSDTAVTFCSYCGVSVQLEGRTVQMTAPQA